MKTWVQWSEPFSKEHPFPVLNVCRAEDIVKWMMTIRDYPSYDEALYDFCVIHHAVLKDTFEDENGRTT